MMSFTEPLAQSGSLFVTNLALPFSSDAKSRRRVPELSKINARSAIASRPGKFSTLLANRLAMSAGGTLCPPLATLCATRIIETPGSRTAIKATRIRYPWSLAFCANGSSRLPERVVSKIKLLRDAKKEFCCSKAALPAWIGESPRSRAILSGFITGRLLTIYRSTKVLLPDPLGPATIQSCGLLTARALLGILRHC